MPIKYIENNAYSISESFPVKDPCSKNKFIKSRKNISDIMYTIKTLKNMSERESMQQKGQKYISANGAKVLVDSILGQL